MTKEISKKIEELREIFSRECYENVCAINIFINCEGSSTKITQRDPAQLKKDSISMRNIAGNWIK